jgi:virginiamycin B lyase
MKKLLLLWLVAAPALAQVTVQEYPVPRGHRVHDVWADANPNGPVWISAQGSGNLGILDPKSGKIDFVPLGRGSSPHGVIAGPDGAPWLTDGGQNAIVRVDPKTRAVKAWPLPEGSGYTNLNTAIFDGKGVHWFTGQSGIYGRLDPKTGEMKVFDAPKGRGPYGIHATPDGTVYFASLAGSYIGRVDGDEVKVRAACGPIPREISGSRSGTQATSAATSPRPGSGPRGKRPATIRMCMRCTSTRPTRSGLPSGPRR